MLPSGILERIGSTPLVPLPRVGAGLPVPLLPKCEHLNPGGSVKDRLALAIVDDAERRGALHRGGTIVEATAGNTGVGLALARRPPPWTGTRSMARSASRTTRRSR